MTDPIIGRRHFIGTSPRPVFEECQTGRQYVVDDEGNRVYGLYLIDPDDDDEDPDATAIYVERQA